MLSAIQKRFVLNYFLNFLSAILLIYLSKWVLRQYPISSLTLTICNCFSSAFFASIILCFLPKPLSNLHISINQLKSSFHMLIISGSFCLFITFSNFSLQYNTIGTYQLIKLQVPPLLMLIEWIELRFGLNSLINEKKFYENYSFTVLLSFGIIVIGTLVNTYSDLYFHSLGVTYACISVICNALYQALVQNDKSSSTYERIRFLQIQTMASGLILFSYWLFVNSAFNINWNLLLQMNLLILFFLLGFLAFLVNSSVIWCIKDDAAIGYNMVGQLKTLLIVFIGSALFEESLTIQQIISILFTTAGCLIYVYVRYKTKERQKHEQQFSMI